MMTNLLSVTFSNITIRFESAPIIIFSLSATVYTFYLQITYCLTILHASGLQPAPQSRKHFNNQTWVQLNPQEMV